MLSDVTISDVLYSIARCLDLPTLARFRCASRATLAVGQECRKKLEKAMVVFVKALEEASHAVQSDPSMHVVAPDGQKAYELYVAVTPLDAIGNWLDSSRFIVAASWFDFRQDRPRKYTSTRMENLRGSDEVTEYATFEDLFNDRAGIARGLAPFFREAKDEPYSSESPSTSPYIGFTRFRPSDNWFDSPNNSSLNNPSNNSLNNRYTYYAFDVGLSPETSDSLGAYFSLVVNPKQ